jgi:hypothetical protein
MRSESERSIVVVNAEKYVASFQRNNNIQKGNYRQQRYNTFQKQQG